MNFLDLAQGDQAVAAGPQPGEAARLPATFGEGFESAWEEGRAFSQSTAQNTDRLRALNDYVDEVRQKTGADITDSVMPIITQSDWSKVGPAVAKLKADRPGLQLDALTPDELNDRAVVIGRAARDRFAEVSGREKASGGGLGTFLGGLAAAVTDPLNLVAAPVGGGEAGIVATGLKFGAAAAATQAANEAVQGQFREQVQPGYLTSGEPLANIAEAGATGAVLGAGGRALGNLWTRVKTGAWPTTVRDAGNILESEANVQQSNVYPGVQGEVAHREALSGAIDQVLRGDPVDVSHIITPEIEASARGIVTRLEGEQAVSLPIFDERTVRLLSEEAGLRTRQGELERNLAELPQGDLSAADRLNRLATVERQIAEAAPEARRALQERRDQILVDTTPEALRAAAAPLAARQVAVAEHANVTARLGEIEAQRALAEPTAQPLLGQRQPIRQVPFEAVRAAAGETTAAAQAERAAAATGPAPELPFKATAAEAKAEATTEALRSSVRQVAERGGHVLAPEDIAKLADRFAKMTPEDAASAMRDLQTAPHQLVERPARAPAEAPTEPVTPHTPDEVARMAGSPDHEAAIRADIDRSRATGDVKIPVDKTAEGEPVFRSVDAALDEVDAFRKAADEIQACANPAQEAAE